MAKKYNSVKEEKIAKFGPAFKNMSNLLNDGKLTFVNVDLLAEENSHHDISVMTKDVFYVRDYCYDDSDEPQVNFLGPFKVLKPFDNISVMSSYMNEQGNHESFIDFLLKNNFIEKIDAQEVSMDLYPHHGNKMSLSCDDATLSYRGDPSGHDLFVLLDKHKLESALSTGLNCSDEPLVGYNTTGTYYEGQMAKRMKKNSNLVKILCKNISSTFFNNDRLYIVSDIKPEDIFTIS